MVSDFDKRGLRAGTADRVVCRWRFRRLGEGGLRERYVGYGM